ncbi:MAG: phage baseplate assembly protein V [Kineothrix sp.]
MAESLADLLRTPNELYDSQLVPGFVQGTVVENNNSSYPGMVKVSFTVWEEGSNMIEWVRLMSPYTGQDYGAYLVPEIDETVLIGFIGGSLKKPVLIGSLYPADARLLKEQFDENNINKVLETKGGVKLQINDTKEKQSVTVTTPKESAVILDDGKNTVTITDKEGKNKIFMDLGTGAVTVQADKKLTLQTGKAQIEMDGNQGGITVKCSQLSVNAEQKIGLEGKMGVKIKGASLAAEGTQSAELKAAGQMVIKGAMVKIN